MTRRTKRVAITIMAVVVGIPVLIALAFTAYVTWGDAPRAERAVQQGNLDEALRLYDSALGKWYWPRSTRAELLVRRGSVKDALKRPEEAFADVNAAVSADPTSVLALIVRGLTFMGKESYDAAVADLSAAVKLQPEFWRPYFDRARVYDAMLENDSAIADYEKVRELAPQFYDAYTNGALALARKGNTKAAKRLIADIPITNVYSADAYMTRAGMFDMVGARDRALADYAQALRLDPHSAFAYGERGIVYWALGEHALAIADYSQSIALSPKSERPVYNRGRENYIFGDYRAARDDLAKANEMMPTDSYDIIWLHLAEIRLGTADQQALADRVAKLKSKRWPLPILEFFLGKRDAASMLAEAKAAKSRNTVWEQTCEAVYYTGALYLAQSKRKAAVPLIEQAAEICPIYFVESVAAKRDLKRLGR